MSIETIELWHKRVRPEPTEREFNTQLGCHFEEIGEMLSAIHLTGECSEAIYWAAVQAIETLAKDLKEGRVKVAALNRKEFLDAIADQVVTGIGVGHCAGMQTAHAVRRVDTSNWSKFIDGQPVFDANGKIAKPDSYQPPNLEGLY